MSVRPLRGSPVLRVGDVRRRRWSESPIPRPGVRRTRTMAAASGEVILRPDYIWDVDATTAPLTRSTYLTVSYTGAAGQNTLRDSSDSTYITISDSTSTSTGQYATIQFEAADIPSTANIVSIDLTIRARTTDPSGDLQPTVAEDIHPTGEYNNDYVNWYNWTAAYRTPGTSWTDVLFEDATWSLTPTSALLRAGTLQCSLSTQSTGGSIDIAEVWLDVAWANP